jgi:hypothetical protein
LDFNVGYFPELAILLGNVELLEFTETSRDIYASREIDHLSLPRLNNGRMP